MTEMEFIAKVLTDNKVTVPKEIMTVQGAERDDLVTLKFIKIAKKADKTVKRE